MSGAPGSGTGSATCRSTGWAHAGDFQQGPCYLLVNALIASWGRRGSCDIGPPFPFQAGRSPMRALRIGRGAQREGVGGQVQVLVRDNNVDQALKALKKKMQREGIFAK